MSNVTPLHPAPRSPSGRLPVHDLGAEETVLATVFGHPARLAIVSGILAAEDWYDETHREIWEAVCALDARGVDVTERTVATWMRDRDRLQRVGGEARIVEIARMVPSSPGGLERYAERVRDLARQRRMVALFHRLTAEGYDAHDDVTAWLDGAAAAVHAVTAEATARRDVHIAAAAAEAIERARTARDRRGVVGISTGLRDLDRRTAGLHRGHLFVIAARPGMGKSALGAQMAAHVASQGEPCAILSYEMPREEIVTRLAAANSGVDCRRIGAGEATDDEVSAFEWGAKRIGELPLYLDDSPPVAIANVRGEVRRLDAVARREHGRGLALVVIDYLQLMGGPLARGENREQQVSSVSGGLKAIARELHVCVIAIAQLNRQCEARADKRPVLSDLRESGSIEQDANAVLFIYRDEVYDRDSRDKGTAELILAKQRGGPTGVARVAWHGPTCTFRSLAGAAP